MKRFCLIFLIAFWVVVGCSSDQQKADKFTREGKVFFENQEYAKAEIQLKNAVKLNPGSAEAYRILSQTYLKQKNGQDAFAAFLRLEQLEPENLETKIQVASFYLLAKNRIQAGKRIDAVLEKEPENIKALYLKAGLLSSKKEDLEAIEAVYDRILELDPGQTRAMLVLAKIYQAQGKTTSIETILKKAVQTDPEDINTHRALFGYYLAHKQVDSARSVLEALVNQRPGDMEPRIMLAAFYSGIQKTDLAEKEYLKAVDLAPENPLPHMLIARFYNSMEEPDKAEGYIKKALSIDPDHDGLKTAYADFYFLRQDYEKAEKMVDEVLAGRPDFPQAKVLKGKLLASQKKLDQAEQIFQSLLTGEPESPAYNFFLGSIFLEKGKPDQALPFFSKTLEKSPNHYRARLMTADIYFQKADYFLAESEIEKALRARPGDYRALLLKGNIHAAQKETKRAETVYQELIRTDPDNPAAYFRLGNLKMAENKPDSALDAYEKALAINPGLMDVFTNVIRLHVSRKEFQIAMDKCNAQLKAAKEENPVIASIILGLKGNLLMALQKPAEAEKVFALSIEKNPKFIQPYLSLAMIYNAEKNEEKELQTYKDLLANRPDQAGSHSYLGTLYEKRGENALAEEHYKKALDLNPEYIPAMNNLAFFYAEQDREMNTALDLARKARELSGEVPAIMDTLGWVYYKKQVYDSAIEEFGSCVEKEPENPIFNFHLGLAYNKKWDYANAEKFLKKALELKKDFKGADEARKILEQM